MGCRSCASSMNVGDHPLKYAVAEAAVRKLPLWHDPVVAV